VCVERRRTRNGGKWEHAFSFDKEKDKRRPYEQQAFARKWKIIQLGSGALSETPGEAPFTEKRTIRTFNGEKSAKNRTASDVHP